MANTDAKFGFRPVSHPSGDVRLAPQAYTIASEYGTALYRGQVVEMTGTGRNIQSAAAGNADNRGVFWGVEYTNASGERISSRYWPASTVATNVKALVYDDPDIVFEVQCDTLAEGDIGANADHIVGTGSALTGDAGSYLEASATATSGKSFTIIGLVNRPDNAYGAYAKALVKFVEHVGISGAGV